MQSVFTDIGKVNFRDLSSYHMIPNIPGLASNSTASAAWLSSDGEALFALPSASGGIFILRLPPHDVHGKNLEQSMSCPATLYLCRMCHGRKVSNPWKAACSQM